MKENANSGLLFVYCEEYFPRSAIKVANFLVNRPKNSLTIILLLLPKYHPKKI